MIHATLPVIQIKDLKILACHGVLPHEKENRQPFLISLDLFVTPSEWLNLPGSDPLSKTICYAEVCATSEKFVQNSSFDLIETLAQKLGDTLLQKFKNLNKVQICIKKPQAPFPSVFENDHAQKNVQVNLLCQKIYPVGIALGSNLGNRQAFLEAAINGLNLLDGLEVIDTSSIFETAPWGETDQDQFLNQCLTANTIIEPFTLLRKLKQLERELGRVPAKKWGPRHIDLDLIFYADFQIQHNVLNLPHPQAALRDFVLRPFYEINPDLKIGQKSVKDLLSILKKGIFHASTE